MEYPNPGVRIVSFGAGRFSGAQEFKHGALSYRDESMDGLEAHLGEGVPLGRHNSVISRCRFRRAGATGGGREGRPRESRILRATAGSSMAAKGSPQEARPATTGIRHSSILSSARRDSFRGDEYARRYL